MRRLYNHIKTVRALPMTTIAINGVRSGSVIDLGAYGNDFRDVVIIPVTGAITDGTHTFTVQESSDGTTFTNIAAGQILGTAAAIVAADDFRSEDLEFGVIPTTNQYLRVQVTSTGVTSGGLIGAVAVLSEGSTSPALRTGS
jgi:hypothetical protein